MTVDNLPPRRVPLSSINFESIDVDTPKRVDIDDVLIAAAGASETSVDELLYPGRSHEFARYVTTLVLNDVLQLAREFAMDAEPRSVLGVLATRSSMTLGELAASTGSDEDRVADVLIGLSRLGLVDQEAGPVDAVYRLTAGAPDTDHRFVYDEGLSA